MTVDKQASKETQQRLAVEATLKSSLLDYAAAKWEQGQGRRSEDSVAQALSQVKQRIRNLVEAAQAEGRAAAREDLLAGIILRD